MILNSYTSGWPCRGTNDRTKLYISGHKKEMQKNKSSEDQTVFSNKKQISIH